MSKKNFFISFFIFVIFFVILTQICSAQRHSPPVNIFNSYRFFKKYYVTSDGRVIDPARNNITTSESQGYLLFISYTVNDRKTFNLAYNWTNKNLRRKDGLFSWIWGKGKNGEFKVLDKNSATDADIHMARISILAYERWKDKKYLKDGLQTINSIWKKEVKPVGNHLVLMPGPNQAMRRNYIEVNPSYFAPYSFKVFKKYAPKYDWDKLTDSCYYYLNEVMSKTKTGLPPNWFLIKNNQIVLENSKRSDFSYDAIRVFWRIYSDYNKTGDKRALPILQKSSFFIKQWKKTKNIYVNYQANGQLRNYDKPMGSIALLLPAISLFDPIVAKEIFQTEIVPFICKEGYWDNTKQYYTKCLLWFGKYMYLTQKAIP